jgi:hypothetical protein
MAEFSNPSPTLSPLVPRGEREPDGVLRWYRPDAPVLSSHAARRLTGARCPPRLDRNMKPAGPAKHFILAFLLALAGYALFYQGIEHRRTRNGPWQVTFTRTMAGEPAIVINQPKLAITNVHIHFTGDSPLPATNAATLLFAQPQPVPYDLPFGKCVFMDTTFLPGTLTFQLFGHEIELLPRVLVIDRQEHPWEAGATIALPSEQPAPARATP